MTGPGDPLWDVAGRVVLVTGAAGGIGGAVARALVDRGAQVVAWDQKSPAAPGLALAGVADLTRDDAVRASLAALAARFDQVDGVVHVAGIGGNGPSDTFAPERWAQIVDTNLSTAFRLCQAVRPLLSSAASIVTVSSIYALRAPYTLPAAAYAASKAGLVGLTRALAAEWGPSGIRVNAVAPGHILTAMTAERLARSDYRTAVETRTPLGRIGTPDDMVGPVLFLLTAASQFVTGQVLVADGGWTIV